METPEIFPEAPSILESFDNAMTESFEISSDNKNYLMNIKIKDNIMKFNIFEKGSIININYSKTMNLKEIKQIHQVFCIFNSCKEFLEYIKALIENKKLSIKVSKEILTIICKIEELS